MARHSTGVVGLLHLHRRHLDLQRVPPMLLDVVGVIESGVYLMEVEKLLLIEELVVVILLRRHHRPTNLQQQLLLILVMEQCLTQANHLPFPLPQPIATGA